MLTYTTLEGDVFDLSDLDASQRAYFDSCVAAYRKGMDAARFNNTLLFGPKNPDWKANAGLITRETWKSPLFQAAHDLCDRLSIKQGTLAAEPSAARDPLEDEWIPATAAAAEKGVYLSALHKAIARRDVLARPAKEGGTRLVVSRRSLEGWTPNPARQASRRRKAA